MAIIILHFLQVILTISDFNLDLFHAVPKVGGYMFWSHKLPTLTLDKAVLKSFFPWSLGFCYGKHWSHFPVISIPPPPARAMRVSFSTFYSENLVGFLEVKPMDMCYPLQYCSSQKFLSLAHTQRPAIHQIYLLNIPISLWLQWILLQISRSQLQLWICLFIQIWGWQVAMQPQFWWVQEKPLIFSFLIFFSFKDLSYNFHILYMWSWNWKSSS